METMRCSHPTELGLPCTQRVQATTPLCGAGHVPLGYDPSAGAGVTVPPPVPGAGLRETVLERLEYDAMESRCVPGGGCSSEDLCGCAEEAREQFEYWVDSSLSDVEGSGVWLPVRSGVALEPVEELSAEGMLEADAGMADPSDRVAVSFVEGGAVVFEGKAETRYVQLPRDLAEVYADFTPEETHELAGLDSGLRAAVLERYYLVTPHLDVDEVLDLRDAPLDEFVARAAAQSSVSAWSWAKLGEREREAKVEEYQVTPAEAFGVVSALQERERTGGRAPSLDAAVDGLRSVPQRLGAEFIALYSSRPDLEAMDVARVLGPLDALSSSHRSLVLAEVRRSTWADADTLSGVVRAAARLGEGDAARFLADWRVVAALSPPRELQRLVERVQRDGTL